MTNGPHPNMAADLPDPHAPRDIQPDPAPKKDLNMNTLAGSGESATFRDLVEDPRMNTGPIGTRAQMQEGFNKWSAPQKDEVNRHHDAMDRLDRRKIDLTGKK